MTTSRTIAAAPAAHPVPVSIRILRRLKPVVVAILRSPLHRILSRDILLLHWSGRSSGTEYTLPISYTELNGRLYLCTRPEGSSWYRNVRSARNVAVTLRAIRRPAVATVLDPASAEALDGLRAFLTRNPGTARLLYHVETDANGKPLESDLAREVLASIVVRIEVEAAALVG